MPKAFSNKNQNAQIFMSRAVKKTSKTNKKTKMLKEITNNTVLSIVGILHFAKRSLKSQ